MEATIASARRYAENGKFPGLLPWCELELTVWQMQIEWQPGCGLVVNE